MLLSDSGQTRPNAAVLIDEAYYEFCGVTVLPLFDEHPNLFVSRTFSKVYGMAAMRWAVCSHKREHGAMLQKAQSPYSVNMLAAMAARSPCRTGAFVEDYVTGGAGGPRVFVRRTSKSWDPVLHEQANFVLFQAGDRAIEIRDSCAIAAFWCGTAATRFPGGASDGGHAGPDGEISERTGGDLVVAAPEVIVFDVDGVLVDVRLPTGKPS